MKRLLTGLASIGLKPSSNEAMELSPRDARFTRVTNITLAIAVIIAFLYALLSWTFIVAVEHTGRFLFLRVDAPPPLAIRIGINVGPVVAGVIGKKKFIYDLWGDSVNTAARMESHGLPGSIQVTETVRERLGDDYRFQDRGEIHVKGKGNMRTYLLLGRSA